MKPPANIQPDQAAKLSGAAGQWAAMKSACDRRCIGHLGDGSAKRSKPFGCGHEGPMFDQRVGAHGYVALPHVNSQPVGVLEQLIAVGHEPAVASELGDPVGQVIRQGGVGAMSPHGAVGALVQMVMQDQEIPDPFPFRPGHPVILVADVRREIPVRKQRQKADKASLYQVDACRFERLEEACSKADRDHIADPGLPTRPALNLRSLGSASGSSSM
jgi:hypothetical protein